MFLIQTNIFISVLRFRQIAAPATRFKYSNGAAQAYLKKIKYLTFTKKIMNFYKSRTKSF